MKIAMIGSGNLATHLSLALSCAGHDIVQVFSRDILHARSLAVKTGCSLAVDALSAVVRDADVYIISVKDDAIADVARQLCEGRAGNVILHTAGSVSIDVLCDCWEHAGVLYPMQSFSKDRKVDFRAIPVFVEASDDKSRSVVMELADSISESVVEMSSDVRRRMHLAAVLASNLTNHCYRLAEKVTEEAGLDFQYLLPLIMETASKVAEMSPRKAQTGPMVRNDVKVMEKQLELITDSMTKEIYNLMAKSIYKDSQEG